MIVCPAKFFIEANSNSVLSLIYEMQKYIIILNKKKKQNES